MNIREADVRSAGMIVVSMRWNFTTPIRQGKTLVSLKRDIPEVGLKSKKNWISVIFCAQIATVRFMLKAQLPRETAVETAG